MSLKRRQKRFKDTLEELLNNPIELYAVPHGLSLDTASTTTTNHSHDMSSLNTRLANFNLANSSCQSTSPLQEQSNHIHTPVSQTDVQSTVLLRKDITPLDHYSSHRDEWPHSDLGYSNSSATSLNNQDADHRTELTNNILCLQQDSIGPFTAFTIKNGTQHKFYTTTMGSHVRSKMNRIEDYPQWCWSIRTFTSTYRFDNIIELSANDKIPMDENRLLREIIIKTVGENVGRYFNSHNDIVRIFSTIRFEYQKRFSTSVRDKSWNSISIGRECPDIEAVDRTLSKMVLQEQFGNPPEYKDRTSNYSINQKILRCVQEGVRDFIIMKGQRIYTGNLPAELIFMLVTFL